LEDGEKGEGRMRGWEEAVTEKKREKNLGGYKIKKKIKKGKPRKKEKGKGEGKVGGGIKVNRKGKRARGNT